MSDFDPQPADTSGRDFQESLFGREELAAPKPGFFGGIMPRDDLGKNPISDSIGQQLLYGSAMVSHFLNAEGPALRLEREKLGIQHMPYDYWETHLRASAKSLDPEPGTQGVGTQALAGLAGFATQVAMGGGPVGGILAVGSTSAYEGYHNARDQGLDEDTSEHMAAAEGGSGALFAALPFGAVAKNSSLGVRLLAQLSLGVGANTGIGMTTRYAQHKILADAGYPELAEQYKAFDRDSILMDAATGLFPAAHLAGTEGLGVAADAMIRKATEIAVNNGRVRDAVSTTTDARAQRERAPGIPIDPQSAAAHTSAEHTALIQTLNRQGIDLSNTPIEEGATFLQPARDPAAMDEARGVFMDVLKEHLGEEVTLEPEARRVAEVLGVTVPEETRHDGPVVAPADEVRPPELPSTGTLLYRGKPIGEDATAATDVGRFLTPDVNVARLYAGESGTVTSEHHEPKNLLEAKTWQDAKKTLGLPKSATMQDLVVAAAKAGHDYLKFKTSNGIEYIELPDMSPDPFAAEPAAAPKALPKKNMKTADAREDSILEYLAKHKRGISMDEARKQGIDPVEMKGPAAKVGIKSAFRKGGMTFDEAAEHLAEEGYPVKDEAGNYDPNRVLAAIDQELRGTPVHSIVNERIALEDEAMLRDRAEIDIKIPDERETEPAVKDMAALEANARGIDNDRATEIMESWEKDDPETVARVRRELEEIIYGSEEGGRAAGGEQDKGSGGPKLGEGESESPEAATESLSTPAERSRPTADSGPGAGFSDTGSDAGDRFAGRDSALAREVIAEHPDAVIVGEDGQAHPAQDALDNVKALEAQAKLEAAKAFDAAADCARRQA